MELDADMVRGLGLAIGLGMLVGLQRERAAEPIAGIRTFPLIALLGYLSALAVNAMGVWLPGIALAALAALLVLGNLAKPRDGHTDAGLTTEMAALVMFLVGGSLVFAHYAVGVVVAGVVAVLLHAKEPLHRFSKAMGESEFHAVIRLVLIGLVILPILPNRGYGPYEVLNPFAMWFMVVLIVGFSLAAYVIQRLLGAGAGALLAGALGGFISSTATTVTYARRAAQGEVEPAAAAVVILVASTTVFVRVLLIVALVAPPLAMAAAEPFAVMGLIMLAVSVIAFGFARGRHAAPAPHDPPSDLRPAIVFGLMYGVVLFAVAWSRARFGGQALYAIAAVSGLTDLDAIVLSTAHMTGSGHIEPALAWRVILAGVLSNTVFKGIIAGMAGGAALFWRVALAFGAALAGGVLLLLLWP